MVDTSISLDEAVDVTRTGDVWVFRGRSMPDRAIQLTTNSPVNHVGMAVVLDDLPPLMWHAELGRSLPDMWSGTHQRGVQLHNLRDAVCVWANRYGQRAWLRQLEPPAGRELEDAVLRTIARLDGTPFPSTARMAWRWLRGRVPAVRRPRGLFAAGGADDVCASSVTTTSRSPHVVAGKRPGDRLLRRSGGRDVRGDGFAPDRPPAELVRPRPILERRRPRPRQRRPTRYGDHRRDPVPLSVRNWP